jgi:hypothetical protein
VARLRHQHSATKTALFLYLPPSTDPGWCWKILRPSLLDQTVGEIWHASMTKLPKRFWSPDWRVRVGRATGLGISKVLLALSSYRSCFICVLQGSSNSTSLPESWARSNHRAIFPCLLWLRKNEISQMDKSLLQAYVEHFKLYLSKDWQLHLYQGNSKCTKTLSFNFEEQKSSAEKYKVVASNRRDFVLGTVSVFRGSQVQCHSLLGCSPPNF